MTNNQINLHSQSMPLLLSMNVLTE